MGIPSSATARLPFRSTALRTAPRGFAFSREGELSIARMRKSELPATLPRGTHLVELEDEYVGVLLPLRRAVEMDDIEVCTAFDGTDADRRCRSASLPDDPADFEFPPLQRSLADLLPKDDAPKRNQALSVEYHFDIDASRLEASRLVEIVDLDPGWQITAIEGVEHVAALPARRVMLRPGPQQGKLVVAHRFEPNEGFSGWLPGLAETPSGFMPRSVPESASRRRPSLPSPD